MCSGIGGSRVEKEREERKRASEVMDVYSRTTTLLEPQ
jgi:hypothetical protein